MKKLIITSVLICLTTIFSFGQDSTFVKINNWLTDNNISIRRTFDGSKDENKPASFSFHENHKTSNDFINVDLGLKISEFPLLNNSNSLLIFYPKIEWHKSTDTTARKNKLDGGVNFEYIPFGLHSPDLPNGLKVAPWFQGTSSFKRNFIEKVYETRLALQLSFVSNIQFLPGSIIRDSKENFRARYYPYFGFEYNKLPNLVSEGKTEDFSTYFVRFFSEIWILPETLQLNIDGTYRRVINNSSSLRTELPILAASLYLYPGKQELFGIGYEYRHGYDPGSKFQLVQMSTLTLAWKI